MVGPTAVVLRDGQAQRIPVADLVPGDLVELAAGDRVPADARLVDAEALRVDEATLTGESVPAGKRVDAVADAALPLADRPGEVFAGTLVVAGRGRATVTMTGPDSQIGRPSPSGSA